MNLLAPTAIGATITGPCWASRTGRYGFATLADGRRVELRALSETHRSGVRLQVMQDERGRWTPAGAVREARA